MRETAPALMKGAPKDGTVLPDCIVLMSRVFTPQAA